MNAELLQLLLVLLSTLHGCAATTFSSTSPADCSCTAGTGRSRRGFHDDGERRARTEQRGNLEDEEDEQEGAPPADELVISGHACNENGIRWPEACTPWIVEPPCRRLQE
nr:unnamed protein product [Digitaria exilis]